MPGMPGNGSQFERRLVGLGDDLATQYRLDMTVDCGHA